MTELKTGLHYPIKLDELPENWTAAYVGDFASELESGFACGAHSDVDIGVVHIRPYNVSREGNFDFETRKYVPSDHNEKRLKADDVLFNNTNSPDLIGKTAVVPRRAVGLAFSNHMTRVAFEDGIDPAFAAHQLHYLWSSRYFLHRCVKHVNQASISTTDLGKTVPFVCPPTNEQRRVVDKIETLFAELDIGVESLTRARARLALYRQSVLKAAFEGRLTADWRAEHLDKLENPETLLTRIQDERTARYKQALDDWQEALTKWRANGEEGKKPAKPKRPRPISSLAMNAIGATNRLTVELGDLISVSSGQGLTAAQMVDGPYPVYGGNGINGHHNEYFLSEPNLVLGRVGAKCGVTHITSGKCWITDNALIVTPLVDCFEPAYFKELLLFENLNKLGSSTGQPVISGSKIYPVRIDLPTKSEQAKIVEILEATLSNIEALEQQIDDGLTRAKALRQSILKRAFAGQLVDQDPSDEPASALLERIKAEKANATPKRRRRSA